MMQTAWWFGFLQSRASINVQLQEQNEKEEGEFFFLIGV